MLDYLQLEHAFVQEKHKVLSSIRGQCVLVLKAVAVTQQDFMCGEVWGLGFFEPKIRFLMFIINQE